MTSSPSSRASLDPACAAVEDQLPWLVNETLGADERRDVELHLATCTRCRASLEAERSLAKLFSTPRDNVDVAPHAAWRTLESRLDGAAQQPSPAGALTGDAGPAPQPATPGRPGATHVRGRGRGRGRDWRARPALMWIVAAQAAAIAGLTLLLWRVSVQPQEASFRTLSSSPALPAPAGITIRIALERNATPAEVQSLAAGIAARVVTGPDARGIATLALPQDAAGSADSAVQWLRAQPRVLLAEPVYQDSPDWQSPASHP
jgi:hypothetical protein